LRSQDKSPSSVKYGWTGREEEARAGFVSIRYKGPPFRTEYHFGSYACLHPFNTSAVGGYRPPDLPAVALPGVTPSSLLSSIISSIAAQIRNTST
jgi:hypothetical protein